MPKIQTITPIPPAQALSMVFTLEVHPSDPSQRVFTCTVNVPTDQPRADESIAFPVAQSSLTVPERTQLRTLLNKVRVYALTQLGYDSND